MVGVKLGREDKEGMNSCAYKTVSWKIINKNTNLYYIPSFNNNIASNIKKLL